MGNEIEMSLRVEFFRDLNKVDQNGYSGSMILDGLKAVSAPRVGEEIHWLNRWRPITTGRVSRVEHHLGGFVPPPEWGEPKPSPSLTAVIEAQRPEDDDMDEAVAEFEAQGWTWDPPSWERKKAAEEAKRLEEENTPAA